MNEQKICCFTGHRNISNDHIVRLPSLLDSLLESLVKKGFRVFRAGGAIGFDTLCALKTLEIKRKYPELDIRLELCLPCRDQSYSWSEYEKNAYDFVLSNADSISYSSEIYTTGCMHERNRKLVDGSDLCLAYLSSLRGGTAYTCQYASKNGVEIINTFDLLRNQS